MIGRMGFPFTVVVAAALLFAVPVTAQETSGPKVEFGFAMGSPGRNVTVPFSLEGAAERNAGRIVSTVTFRGDIVSFVRLERAGLLDEGIETKATLRELAKDAKTTERVLDVLVLATRETTVLADGILGYLVFRIDPTAEVEKTPEVVLDAQSKIFAHKATDQDPPLAVASEKGRILLEHPDVPIIACFFYMH